MMLMTLKAVYFVIHSLVTQNLFDNPGENISKLKVSLPGPHDA